MAPEVNSPHQKVQEVPAEKLGSRAGAALQTHAQGRAGTLPLAGADGTLCVSGDTGTEGYAYNREMSPHPLEEARFSRYIHHRATVTDLNHLLMEAPFSDPPGGLSPWALAS